MSKIQTISGLFAHTCEQVTHSPQAWMDFLTTASRFYKAYDFDDQLLIYAQCPNASACADIGFWNDEMRRWVNAGTTAIALIRKGYGGKPYLSYVHDIADTHPVKDGKTPWIWQMRPEHETVVCEMLREKFDGNGTDLGTLLMDTGEKLALEVCADMTQDLIYEKADSFLEELDDLNIEVAFRNLVRTSTQYELLTRCGIDPADYLDEDDLRGVTDFNTPAVLAYLGTATAQASRTALLEVGRTVRQAELDLRKKDLAKPPQVLYNENTNFTTLARGRSIEHGEVDLHRAERISGAGSDDGRDAGADTVGTLREAAGEVPDGAPQGTVQLDADDRQAVDASDGDRPAGGGDVGPRDGAAGTDDGRDREAESGKSDGVGAADEQHPPLRGGKRTERPDLRLTEIDTPFSTPADYGQVSLFRTPEKQIEQIADSAEAPAPALFAARLTDSITDRILAAGGNERNSSLRIYARYQAADSAGNIAAFLKKEYGVGGRGFTVDGAPFSLWFDETGIRIAGGKAARFAPSAVHFTWEQAEQRIRKLVERGAYLPADQVPWARGNEYKELSQNLWYMMQDTENGPKIKELMPVLSDLYAGPPYGFPDATKRILDTLQTPEGLKTITDEVRVFYSAYAADPELMRWKRYAPVRQLRTLEELAQPARVFATDPDFQSVKVSFITQDEVDAMISEYPGNTKYRLSVSSYFALHPDRKERQDSMKNRFGLSGQSDIVRNIWCDSKGMKLERSAGEKYDAVLLRWPQVEKRISELIAADRFLTEEDKQQIPDYTKNVLARRIDRLFACAPATAECPYQRGDISSDNTPEIVAMLTEPKETERLQAAMQNVLQGMTPEDRGYDACIRAYDSLTAYRNGTFDLWKSDPAVSAQAKQEKAQTASQKPTSVLDEAARKLFQGTAPLADGDQLSLDMSPQPTPSVEPTEEQPKLRTITIDLTAPSKKTEKQYDLGYGHLGNGMTVWNKAELADGDYKTVAHIQPDRTVTFYEDVPDAVRSEIEKIARTTEMTVSATQDAPVFSTSAQPEPEKESDGEIPTEQGENKTIIIPNNESESAVRFEETADEPKFHINGEAYLRLKAEYSTHMIGVQDGPYILFCGADATQIVTDYPRKVYEQDIPGMGKVPVTGFAEGWQAVGSKLQQRGRSVTFGQENDGEYEVIQSLDISEYIPLRMKLVEDGRIFTVESVDYSAGEVELRDDTFASHRGFPIFRNEPVSYVREWVEQQRDADLTAAAEGKEPLNPVLTGEDALNAALLEQAKGLILDFWSEEYRSDKTEFPPETDLHHVGLAYSTAGDNDEHEIQVEADLIDYAINYYADGVLVLQEKWDSLQELIHIELETLDFDVLYSTAVHEADFPEEPEQSENFHLTDGDINVGGQKSKYQDNVAAIRLLKELETEQRQATPDEQSILARYSGWGGIPQAFDEQNEKWEKEYFELKTLLTPEEYAAARSSTLNAHYTSPTVIRAMYAALEHMGVKPNTVLEPAMGIGNFFGLLPEQYHSAKLYGVELDSVTGRIAKQLYPEANITVDGFERVELPDNAFDLAIGNVPFGSYKLSEPRYNENNFLIHDHFFAKSLDKVHPGGIVAFITSKGTLDKKDCAVREYLAQRGDLLGAIRLPSNAFAKNANTEVTSDIVFLQKREQPPEQLPDWVELGQTADGVPVNRYFEQHPEMILGTMVWGKKMYSNDLETRCLPVEDADLGSQLATAIQHLDQPDTQLLSTDTAELPEIVIPSVEEAEPVRSFSYTEQDGVLYYKNATELEPVSEAATTMERIRGMISIRDITRSLIDLQMRGGTDAEIQELQADLNDAYDTFTAKYGLLCSTANKRAFEQDSSYCLLRSLEIIDEDTGKLERKADMFTKRTINREIVIDHVDTASEALAVSIGERACVDLPFMASLLGREDTESIVAELQGVIYKDPTAGEDALAGWQTADEYLSGNVRKKLTAAREAAERDPAFAGNVTALAKAQPADLTAAEIDVRIGATWIEPEYYTQFVHELLKPSHWAKREVRVLYSEATGEWRLTGKTADSENNSLAYVTYGTKRRNAYTIIEDSLNLKDSRVYDTVTDASGKETRELNTKETILAQQRQDLIREAFKSWIWKDPERRETLCKKYNDLYNAIRPREYNGEHLRFTGMTPDIALLPHQRNAVARMLYGGNSLLAHCVGAGKTFECIAAAMEAKRLGLVKKNLVVVPNHLTEQWGADFLRLYPGANILVATKKDFEPANRKTFCSRIATGDYDAVVIGHTQFEKIPLSPDRQKAVIHDQIDQILESIDEAKSQNGERYTIKQLERMRKTLETRLDKLNDQSRKDNVIYFEELGVDKLFVDEGHLFKNLFLATKMRNVAGIGQTDAQKSSDMFAKCRYLDEITGGKGVVFATGTPVSNSMSELYTMMRYLQYDLLEETGLLHFDSWAANFGETVTSMELAPEGTGFRSRTRFAKFFNLPELMAMWRESADIQTAEMLKLPVPEHESITVVTKPSAYQQDMVSELGERAEAIRRRMVEPKEDNMLKVTSDGRKLALDQRLVDPTLPDDPESKVNVCVQNVYQVWQDTAEQSGAQLIFSDLSTPKGDGSFNVYEDIKQKLMEKGIPPEEIAFIHDAKTENQKAELFAKVRKGQVRVLLGSTAKMGAGTNVQTRLAALHHIDCPWRPADIEQREGRILRRGNLFKKVKLFKYVTEGTFDAYNWSILENKQKFIGQLMSSKNPSRTCEDVDAAALSYAEVKALASGDPRIIEYTELDAQVTKLKLVKANFESQKYALEDKLLKFFPQSILREQEFIQALTEDSEHLQEHTPIEFSMQIGGVTYTERKAAGQAILDACTAMQDVSEKRTIGEYRGFPITLWANVQTQKFQLTLHHKLSQEVELGADAVGNTTRIDHVLDEIPKNLEKHKTALENLTAQQQEAQEEVKRPFAQEQELTDKTNRLNVLRLALHMDDGEKPQAEHTEEKPSIRGMLKRMGMESAATAAAPGRSHSQEAELA